MNSVGQIKLALHNAFQAEHIDIVDESHKHAGHIGAKDGGGHFIVHVVSHAFAGKSRVLRHRMVNEATKHLFPEIIHALSIKAQTPEENT